MRRVREPGRLTPAEASRAERRFEKAVNMRPDEIEAWLRTPESLSVGFKYPGDDHSVGWRSGKRIVELLRRGPRTLSDWQHMRKVAGYVARHLAQRPAGDVRRTRWRYSLMNGGHDPLGEGEL